MALGGKTNFKDLLDGFKGSYRAAGSDLIQITGRLLRGFKKTHERSLKPHKPRLTISTCSIRWEYLVKK